MALNGNSSRAIEEFLQSLRTGRRDSRGRAESVAAACQKALQQARILHDVEPVTVDISRVEGEVRVREELRGKRYSDVDEIEKEVDSVGVVIQVHLPREVGHVRAIINQEFIVRWMPTSWVRSQTVQSTEFCWVSLKQDEILFPWKTVRVQIVTDPGKWQFQTQHEMGVFLAKWMAIKKRNESLGDIEPLWELLGLLHLRQMDNFRDILANLDMSKTIAGNFQYKSGTVTGNFQYKTRHFDPIKLSLAMYVAESIISKHGEGRIRGFTTALERQPKPEQQRVKLKTIRNSFIWLARLSSWGEGAARVLFSGVDRVDNAMQAWYKERIAWLDKTRVQDFHEGEDVQLSEEEERNIEELWRLFDQHYELPIQFVFNLARLGVEGHTPLCWYDFRKAIAGLVY
ncbi:hypothetical protein BDV18DRAFT_162171 [Aspergillus unguis]